MKATMEQKIHAQFCALHDLHMLDEDHEMIFEEVYWGRGGLAPHKEEYQKAKEFLLQKKQKAEKNGLEFIPPLPGGRRGWE